jgi:hypothetical protein
MLEGEEAELLRLSIEEAPGDEAPGFGGGGEDAVAAEVQRGALAIWAGGERNEFLAGAGVPDFERVVSGA